MQRQQVSRHVQRCVQSDGHPAVQAHGRVKNAVEIAERDPTLGLVVHEEAEGVSGVQIEEHAHRGTLLHPPLGPLRVAPSVHEPRTLPVYVHAPTLVVLACADIIISLKLEQFEVIFQGNSLIYVTLCQLDFSRI